MEASEDFGFYLRIKYKFLPSLSEGWRMESDGGVLGRMEPGEFTSKSGWERFKFFLLGWYGGMVQPFALFRRWERLLAIEGGPKGLQDDLLTGIPEMRFLYIEIQLHRNLLEISSQVDLLLNRYLQRWARLALPQILQILHFLPPALSFPPGTSYFKHSLSFQHSHIHF